MTKCASLEDNPNSCDCDETLIPGVFSEKVLNKRGVVEETPILHPWLQFSSGLKALKVLLIDEKMIALIFNGLAHMPRSGLIRCLPVPSLLYFSKVNLKIRQE